jgi:prefoldin subunit 5
MSEKQKQAGGKLGFLDPLARLFRAREATPEPEPQAASRLDSFQESFDAALQGLERKLEESRRAAPSTGPAAAPLAKTAEEREAESQRRMEEAHRAIRGDIEQMHARLGTELTGEDLTQLAAYLEELHAEAAEGKGSHGLLPRLRHAVAERLRKESGELAIARLVALLEREKLAWPDPTHYRASASPEEIERSRQRRLREVRESFLAQDLGRMAERVLGIVGGWKSDYPDRGSPLWEETVLEGVAAGIRGQLVKESAEILRRDRELIFDRAQESIGKELEAIHAVLQEGVHSLEQANQAVASSLRVLDQVFPEIAWQHVQSQLAHARGEYSS